MSGLVVFAGWVYGAIGVGVAYGGVTRAQARERMTRVEALALGLLLWGGWPCLVGLWIAARVDVDPTPRTATEQDWT